MNQTTTPAALDLDKLEALARAADVTAMHVGEWPNIYRIADGITLDTFAELIAFANPKVILALIDHARRSSSAAGSEQDELHIGMSNNDQGVHVSIIQRHADGTSTVIFTDKVPTGDSYARAAIAQRAASAPADDRFYMDHGVLHDRATGQHMWTQDQYDEQWRDMYRAGHEHAAMGYNMFAAPSPTQQAAPEAPASAQPAEFGGMPGGYVVKRVEGHGWVIDPPKGSRWVAFEGTPAGDLLANLASAQPVAAAPALRNIVLEEAACAVESLPCSRDDHSTILRCVVAIRAKIAAPAAPVAQVTTACTVPPPGWYCTRDRGHDGPCAAHPAGADHDPVHSEGGHHD